MKVTSSLSRDDRPAHEDSDAGSNTPSLSLQTLLTPPDLCFALKLIKVLPCFLFACDRVIIKTISLIGGELEKKLGARQSL